MLPSVYSNHLLFTICYTNNVVTYQTTINYYLSFDDEQFNDTARNSFCITRYSQSEVRCCQTDGPKSAGEHLQVKNSRWIYQIFARAFQLDEGQNWWKVLPTNNKPTDLISCPMGQRWEYYLPLLMDLEYVNRKGDILTFLLED